ncbi:MAG: DUF2752 domain-containing protein [Pseudonocardiaceae bacterium]|nr:DUF2752 domain-containing protein [Pseudonocardiaceae bacterium]
MTLAVPRPPVARALGPPLAVAVVGTLGCAAVWWADPTTPGGPIPVCPSKALLGISCPGCGSMRMIYSLLHADVPAALHYNALAVAVLVLFGWSFAAWTYGRLRGRLVRSWLHWRWTPLAFLVAIGMWLIVRNIPFAPFGSLHV